MGLFLIPGDTSIPNDALAGNPEDSYARPQIDASLLRSLVSELTGFQLVCAQGTTTHGYLEAEHDDSLLKTHWQEIS
jgi:hypothetical protein